MGTVFTKDDLQSALYFVNDDLKETSYRLEYNQSQQGDSEVVRHYERKLRAIVVQKQLIEREIDKLEQ